MLERKIPCPSCRAEIVVTPEGDAANPEVAHFHVGDDKPDEAGDGVPALDATVPEGAPPVAPVSTNGGGGSFWDRANANLTRTLKG